MALSEKLMSHVGAFRVCAADLVKTIIDELPTDSRTYQPSYRLKNNHAVFMDTETDNFDGLMGDKTKRGGV